MNIYVCLMCTCYMLHVCTCIYLCVSDADWILDFDVVHVAYKTCFLT